MGYAVIMFVIMLLLAVSIALSSNYGISKDSQEAPLLAENVYAEREGGKMQTDLVVEMTKVNGTMLYTSADGGTASDPLNLYLRIKNNGSIILSPLKYSILLNRTWVRINSSSDSSTPPLENSTTASLNLTQRPLSLLVSAENGVKVMVPTAPRINFVNVEVSKSDSCYYNLTLAWIPSNGSWPLTHYALYYTYSDNIHKNDNVSVALTIGPDTSMLVENAFRKPGGGQSCSNASGESQLYLWLTAYDSHGNEGVPSNTCKTLGAGGAVGERCT